MKELILSNIEIDPSGCWLWTGLVTKRGYGMFSVAKRLYTPHRVSYREFKGPIEIGNEIDHLCRVRRCVNPEHLESVTKRENILRGESFSAKNARKTHCKQGHPYAGENLMHHNGQRMCRTCRIKSSQKTRDTHGERMRADERRRYWEKKAKIRGGV